MDFSGFESIRLAIMRMFAFSRVDGFCIVEFQVVEDFKFMPEFGSISMVECRARSVQLSLFVLVDS